jgi:hypothetical protein
VCSVDAKLFAEGVPNLKNGSNPPFCKEVAYSPDIHS